MARNNDVVDGPAGCLGLEDSSVLGVRQLHQVAEGLALCAAACPQRPRRSVAWLTRAAVGSDVDGIDETHGKGREKMDDSIRK